MLTHNHDNFPSDVFTIMAAAGSTVSISYMEPKPTAPTTSDVGTGEYPLWDFLNVDMANKVSNKT